MEKLYNNIVLGDNFPPKYDISVLENQLPVPYLENPPEIINISLGRQLFVDDFLIEETTLSPEYHSAKKMEGNPVFFPQSPWEKGDDILPCAAPKSGGVWYDEKENKFKMWYEAGWLNQMAYAESDDGINWTRPDLDVEPGTNKILTYNKIEDTMAEALVPDKNYFRPDSTTVIIDDDGDKSQRYKMFMRGPGGDAPGLLMTSADGIHWENQTFTTPKGDRSTIFYNPFRKKWVHSIRDSWNWETIGRTRNYSENSNFLESADFAETQVPWLCGDSKDKPHPGIRMKPQVYNVDAVAYESIMLGMFQVHYGPENAYSEACGKPKITELIPMYSRDGFHFSRPCRESIIKSGFSERNYNAWDLGYIQSVGGICVIHGDELWIYYTGVGGNKDLITNTWWSNGMYSGGSLGIATLRRDGFVSMNTSNSGTLTTRKLEFFDKKYMFANFEGTLFAEIIADDGISAKSVEITADSTCKMLDFGDFDLSGLSGKPFRIKFTLTNGKLYSFWFSNDKTGESGGYKAAGEAKI